MLQCKCQHFDWWKQAWTWRHFIDMALCGHACNVNFLSFPGDFMVPSSDNIPNSQCAKSAIPMISWILCQHASWPQASTHPIQNQLYTCVYTTSNPEPGSSLVVWEQVLLSANPKFESREGWI
jgi:hypothetical protein